MVLAAAVSLVLGAIVQHAVDQRNAARNLYRGQVLTTASRFLTEEQRQVGLPVSQRSAVAFGNLTQSITEDQGINGSGRLTVSLGAGSTAPPAQIAFPVTVASPYAATTFAVWDIGGAGSSDEGACVLQSSLLGTGHATTNLPLGGGEYLQPCSAHYWSGGSREPMQPNLGLAGIPEPPQ